jgi:peptidoglycan/LPS O-acetylase OafA/YrhL
MAFAGGVALCAAPFTRSGQAGPPWIRIAFWISGPTALGWSVLGFALLVGSGSFSKSTNDLFVHFKTLFGGMALAILILLFASGEFARLFGGHSSKGK